MTNKTTERVIIERLEAENKRLRRAHEEIADLPNRAIGWEFAANISKAALENSDERVGRYKNLMGEQ